MTTEQNRVGGVPLQRSTLREDAARVLRNQINTGILDPDRLYSIGEVAETLGTSATPVREAVLSLSQEGLVTLERNRGFRVRLLSTDELNEIMECRLLLEIPPLAKLAGTLSRSHIEHLYPLAELTVQSAITGDNEAFLASNRAFHLELLHVSGNSLLVSMVAQLRDRTRLRGLGSVENTEELIASAKEHRDMVDLLVSGTPREMTRLLERHIEHVHTVWGGS